MHDCMASAKEQKYELGIDIEEVPHMEKCPVKKVLKFGHSRVDPL